MSKRITDTYNSIPDKKITTDKTFIDATNYVYYKTEMYNIESSRDLLDRRKKTAEDVIREIDRSTLVKLNNYMSTNISIIENATGLKFIPDELNILAQGFRSKLTQYYVAKMSGIFFIMVAFEYRIWRDINKKEKLLRLTIYLDCYDVIDDINSYPNRINRLRGHKEIAAGADSESNQVAAQLQNTINYINSGKNYFNITYPARSVEYRTYLKNIKPIFDSITSEYCLPFIINGGDGREYKRLKLSKTERMLISELDRAGYSEEDITQELREHNPRRYYKRK